jgi:hypothetical protein
LQSAAREASDIEDLSPEQGSGEDDQDEDDNGEDKDGDGELEGERKDSQEDSGEPGIDAAEKEPESDGIPADESRKGKDSRPSGWIRHVAQRTGLTQDAGAAAAAEMGDGLDGLIRAIGLDKSVGWKAGADGDGEADPAAAAGGHGHRRKRRPAAGNTSPTSGDAAAAPAESAASSGAAMGSAFGRGGSCGSSSGARRARRRSGDGSSSGGSDAGDCLAVDASFASDRDISGDHSRRREADCDSQDGAVDDGAGGSCGSPGESTDSCGSDAEEAASNMTGGEEDDNAD